MDTQPLTENANRPSWREITEAHFVAGTSPTWQEVEAQWEGITEQMIRQEIRELKALHPGVTTFWLVPSKYVDGGIAVSGSPNCYTSDARRRNYSSRGNFSRVY